MASLPLSDASTLALLNRSVRDTVSDFHGQCCLHTIQIVARIKSYDTIWNVETVPDRKAKYFRILAFWHFRVQFTIYDTIRKIQIVSNSVHDYQGLDLTNFYDSCNQDDLQSIIKNQQNTNVGCLENAGSNAELSCRLECQSLHKFTEFNSNNYDNGMFNCYQLANNGGRPFYEQRWIRSNLDRGTSRIVITISHEKMSFLPLDIDRNFTIWLIFSAIRYDLEKPRLYPSLFITGLMKTVIHTEISTNVFLNLAQELTHWPRKLALNGQKNYQPLTLLH